MVNQADAEDTITIACKRTIGDDETFHVDVYTQDSTSQTALYPDDATNVVGFTWNAQASDYKEEEGDYLWQATSSYSTLEGESETTDNKIYACYVAKELSKIGRNPSDFDKTYDLTLGARIYENDEATDFITIPA